MPWRKRQIRRTTRRTTRRKQHLSSPFDNKITEEKGADGKNYKVMNGTWYHHDTDESMIRLLEQLRNDRTRVRFHWGDTKTGLDWGDEYDVRGRIGRSTGSIKIPLLIKNAKSTGGGGILDHAIVMIESSPKGQVFYKHPDYHTR